MRIDPKSLSITNGYSPLKLTSTVDGAKAAAEEAKRAQMMVENFMVGSIRLLLLRQDVIPFHGTHETQRFAFKEDSTNVIIHD